MQHIDFVLWLVLYPISLQLCQLIKFHRGKQKEYSEEIEAISGLLVLAFYIYIAVKLY